MRWTMEMQETNIEQGHGKKEQPVIVYKLLVGRVMYICSGFANGHTRHPQMSVKPVAGHTIRMSMCSAIVANANHGIMSNAWFHCHLVHQEFPW
jgi:hypothetical protein